jgi:hypothetical protein
MKVGKLGKAPRVKRNSKPMDEVSPRSRDNVPLRKASRPDNSSSTSTPESNVEALELSWSARKEDSDRRRKPPASPDDGHRGGDRSTEHERDMSSEREDLSGDVSYADLSSEYHMDRSNRDDEDDDDNDTVMMREKLKV